MPAVASTAKTEQYVYGVVLADAPTPRVRGVRGSKLRRIVVGELAAIVSDVAPPLEAEKEDLLAHARVLERTREKASVLPMRFGVLMPTADLVREQLLEPHASDLAAQLRELAGMLELHLRALYVEKSLMREVVEGNPKVAAMSESLRDLPADAAYYERIELGQEVSQAVDAIAMQDTAEILEKLEPLATAIVVNERGDERVACDAAFLVAQDDLQGFDRAVDELGRRNDGRLRFSYTGPHPPYSFVELSGEA
jgi:Gas vesicle synthesis protein GvpL/GvpF